MRKIYTTMVSALLPLLLFAQGWPAQYGGVMMQGFAWDSYADSRWSVLEAQADELGEYFDLLWVPNSGYCGTMQNNMGYHPMYWFRHEGAFGSEQQLRSMIQTLRQKGVGVIEDVVINHRVGTSNWCDFPSETWQGSTYQLGLADICQDDECAKNGYKPTGAKDTGEPWNYARDLDHTSQNVQQNVIGYERFLLNDLGYVGFRYDFVKGFAPRYVGLYNSTTQPTYSVGECWDGVTTIKNWIDGTKTDGVIQSAAFDFPMKYNINDAFSNGGNWGKLNNQCLTSLEGYDRYSVTFIDNHDTYRTDGDGGAPLKANIEAANAYLLTMPGTPCVFLRHWQMYKTPIKKMIFVRRAAGITNQSHVAMRYAHSNGYVLKVDGTKGGVMLILGNPPGVDYSGYQKATEGENYALYVAQGVDVTGIDDIKDIVSTWTAPSFCTPEEGKLYAFFEVTESVWSQTVKCWCWNGQKNFTGGSWPGATCTKVGTTDKGNAVWKWTGPATTEGTPTGIIFSSNGSPQTTDLEFVNGGYYTITGLQGVVDGSQSGIANVASPAAHDGHAYTVDGRQAASTLRRGLYIQNGRKFIVK